MTATEFYEQYMHLSHAWYECMALARAWPRKKLIKELSEEEWSALSPALNNLILHLETAINRRIEAFIKDNDLDVSIGEFRKQLMQKICNNS